MMDLITLLYDKIDKHTDTLGKVIDSLSALGSIFGGIATLWVGISIAKKLSYHNKTVENEYDKIQSLLDSIDSFYFLIGISNHGLTYENFFPVGKLDPKMSNYLDFTLLFEITKYELNFSRVFEIANSTFLPKQIKNKLLKIYTIFSENDSELTYITPQFQSIEKSIILTGGFAKTRLGYCTFKNENNFTFGDYINLWDDLIEEINKWFKNNNIKTRVKRTEKFIKPEEVKITF